MVDEGVLQNPAPDLSLALHLWNDKPLGWVGVTDGPAMAASERIFELLDTHTEVTERPGAAVLPPFADRIEFADDHTDHVAALIEQGTATVARLHWRCDLYQACVIARPGKCRDSAGGDIRFVSKKTVQRETRHHHLLALAHW